MAPFRMLKGTTALTLIGVATFLPAVAPPLPPALIRGAAAPPPLRCTSPHVFSIEANGLPAFDGVRGPLELRVPGCGGGDWLEPGASAATCLAGRSLLFVGDSTMRFQYLNFLSFLHGGDMLVGEPPLEIDSPTWGPGWDDFFKGSALRVPHICDCARCAGNQLFDPSARWRVGPGRGVETLCAMENRYYVHEPSGTRAAFSLMFGRNNIPWNGGEFLGLPCHEEAAAAAGARRRAPAAGAPPPPPPPPQLPRCAQQGCTPGACYPPERAAPPHEALPALIEQARATDVVLNAGVWGSYEEEEHLAPLLAALEGAAAARAARGAAPLRYFWRTSYPPRPGATAANTEWNPAWHAPRAEAAFRERGWGVVDAGALVAALVPLANLSAATDCSFCVEAVEGRVPDTAPHWSCVFCVLRDEAWGAGELAVRNKGLLAELGEEGGRTRAWPFAEPDATAQALAGEMRAGGRSTDKLLGRVEIGHLWHDWIHVGPWVNRLVNTLLVAHLCTA
jgi:hypothetical protein